MIKLAQDLGATTAILSGNDAPLAVIEYARQHNISKLIFGRSRGRSLLGWGPSFARRLAKLAPEVDFVEVGHQEAVASGAESPDRGEIPEAAQNAARLRYVWAAAACALPTLIGTLLQPYFDPANIVMLFLLTVVIVAVMFGRGPAALTTLLGVASFDFFFVPPRGSFSVSDVQYLLTFGVMLAVGLVTGQLTAGLRYQARVAAHREERSRALRGYIGLIYLDQERSAHTRLNDMQISEPKLIQALRNVGMQRYRVRIGHCVEGAAGCDAYRNAVAGPGRSHRADDLKKKTNPIFNWTAVFVGPLVATILKKLVY